MSNLSKADSRALAAPLLRQSSWPTARRSLSQVDGSDVGLHVYSPSMEKVLRLAARVAECDSSILVVGESGVGKERLARFVHDRSHRANGPFIAVNCGAIPEPLFESELFGHARGAFTGALQDRTGLFESAEQGTLLLDEVGELPHSTQVKLLRTLQEREVRRVGENRQRKIDVRVIAATNRNLEQDVAERRFRLDLLYRLKVVELTIPPLRDRPEDLRRLARTFLTRVAHQMHRSVSGYTPDALDLICRYPWPGNVRELENAVERACALSTGSLISPDDLPDAVRRHTSLIPFSECVRPLKDVEREYILAALHRNNGNKTLTAQQLDIGAATLFRKLKRYAQAR